IDAPLAAEVHARNFHLDLGLLTHDLLLHFQCLRPTTILLLLSMYTLHPVEGVPIAAERLLVRVIVSAARLTRQQEANFHEEGDIQGRRSCRLELRGWARQRGD